jgi:hypothetical protein
MISLPYFPPVVVQKNQKIIASHLLQVLAPSKNSSIKSVSSSLLSSAYLILQFGVQHTKRYGNIMVWNKYFPCFSKTLEGEQGLYLQVQQMCSADFLDLRLHRAHVIAESGVRLRSIVLPQSSPVITYYSSPLAATTLRRPPKHNYLSFAAFTVRNFCDSRFICGLIFNILRLGYVIIRMNNF